VQGYAIDVSAPAEAIEAELAVVRRVEVGHIIETLKMQGVEQFGDFAIQIRMKMMTRPGEQFTITVRAQASGEDLVLEVDGIPVNGMDDLQRLMDGSAIGRTLPVRFQELPGSRRWHSEHKRFRYNPLP
jgi:small-conductance mechanosensitive channel